MAADVWRAGIKASGMQPRELANQWSKSSPLIASNALSNSPLPTLAKASLFKSLRSEVSATAARQSVRLSLRAFGSSAHAIA